MRVANCRVACVVLDSLLRRGPLPASTEKQLVCRVLLDEKTEAEQRGTLFSYYRRTGTSFGEHALIENIKNTSFENTLLKYQK
jgi:hypothetical protein